MRDEIPRSGDWIQPAVPREGLARYLEVIRERRWLVIGALALAVAGSLLYLVVAPKTYEAQADLLVTPASESDELLSSLGVLRDSSDPTRAVETAARLVIGTDVANRAGAQLGETGPPEDLLEKVSVEPVAQSSVVTVTAEGSTGEQAAARANAFAVAVVDERTASLRAEIRRVLPGIRAAAATPGVSPETAADLNGDIARLRALSESGDPTIRVETTATVPRSPSSPRPMLALGTAVIVGLLLGFLAAFVAQALDPRLRREEQLRSRYSLPILSRIPRQSPRNRSGPLSPDALTPATAEAYRTLRATVDAARYERGSTEAVLITGSSPSEGKTTTALNLAVALALAGNKVILIEGDLRRPVIGQTLGIDPRNGLVSVLVGDTPMERALETSESIGPDLRLLLADSHGDWTADLFSEPSAIRLIDEARNLAEFVIVDSPPLTAVVDTLPLARAVDDVIVITRLDVTRLDRLHDLAEMLSGNDVDVLGFAVVGGRSPENGYYYSSRSPDRSGQGRADAGTHERRPERERRRRASGEVLSANRRRSSP